MIVRAKGFLPGAIGGCLWGVASVFQDHKTMDSESFVGVEE